MEWKLAPQPGVTVYLSAENNVVFTNSESGDGDFVMVHPDSILKLIGILHDVRDHLAKAQTTPEEWASLAAIPNDVIPW
jgi:hypothetical protein